MENDQELKKSESIENLAKALIAFQASVKPLTLDREVKVKTKSGAEYSFKYATFKNCKESTQKLLADNGLAISHVIGQGGSVTTILIHESGEYIYDTCMIAPVDMTPQGIGSAISYNKRYGFTSILGLVSDDDDDANIAEGNQFITDNKKEKKDGNIDEKKNKRIWLNREVPRNSGKITDNWFRAVAYLRGDIPREDGQEPKITDLEKRFLISITNKEALMNDVMDELFEIPTDERNKDTSNVPY